jgi:phosphoribosyl 1,2-cyclic phosphodiesterase
MKCTFWGVRGSIPVPGPTTAGYGGNTSCIEIHDDDAPSLILDCGTGVRKLGGKLMGLPGREIHILFTHFHMDHLFGIGFFTPVFVPGFHITVTAPAFHPDGPRDRLGRFLNGVFHPVRIPDLGARLDFDAVRPGDSFQRGPWNIRGFTLNHPGGACGYRIDRNGRSTAYVTDTSPLSRPGEGLSGGKPPTSREQALCDFLRGTDLVIFDTMYTYEQYKRFMTYGHSYPEYAVEVCKHAGVKTLCLFHHDTEASDATLDALAAKWADHESPRIFLAREGVTVDLEG